MQTIFSYIQSRFGNLFFLPKSCIPGYHNYFISVDKVPKEKLEEECVMCYTSLKMAVEDQFAEAANEQNVGGSVGGPVLSDAATPLKENDPEINEGDHQAKKSKKCAVTPCKHYFHVSCFKQWIKVKHECPICRTQLKFYLE